MTCHTACPPCEGCEDLRATSESWRVALVAWQDWAARLLAEWGLQPEGGLLGDEAARGAIEGALSSPAGDRP
jgi:hypothetical protein